MLYEWDEDKRQSNIDQHGIDFECMYDFEWETAVIDPSPRGGEMRYIGISYIGDRLRTVIYAKRDPATRIISLRPSSDDEEAHYAQA